MKETLKKALQSSWIIIKLVIPFSIASDLLQFYGIIESVSFIFEPFTNSLHLPSGVALSFASVIFFNIYAGIAVASTLGLSSYEWTIVGTFMAICHSIPLEVAVLKKVGMNIHIHWISRFILGYVGALIAMYVTPLDLHLVHNEVVTQNQLQEFLPYLLNSIYNSLTLALKVILLVVSLIFIFELLKKSKNFKNFLEKHSYMSSLSVGGLLGVTYGASILLQEIKQVQPEAKLLLLVFLMLAHGLVEETLLFAFFGADIWNIFMIRVGIALLVVFVLFLIIKEFKKRNFDGKSFYNR